MQILIDVKETVSARLKKLAGRLSASSLNAAAGNSVRNTVREHLIRFDAQHPNALGGKRTHYYARTARNHIRFNSSEQGATIRIARRGFRYQVKGGTIRPSGRISAVTGRPITRLAIPIDARAHGCVPSDFGGELFLLRSKERNGAFLVREAGKGKRRSLEFLYVLKHSVSKGPTPGVMPARREVLDAVLRDFGRYFKR